MEMNGVKIVYGFYDITIEQGEYLAKKFGFENFKQMTKEYFYKNQNLHVGYNLLDHTEGSKCLVMGYCVEDFTPDKTLRELVPTEVYNEYEQYSLDMGELMLGSPYLLNGLGFIFIKDNYLYF